MASIFTYQDEPPRIHSPWSTPGHTTPQPRISDGNRNGTASTTQSIIKLEPENQNGPVEYKLHLLLRSRRKYTQMSTGDPTFLLSQTYAMPVPSARQGSETLLPEHAYQPSPQTRQTRLQQLTTQLLWRLQQSSPFHSSSNAELVLPVLPEATPRLGVPERPSKLLPGLEESQGALYEIGVADDGTLVGLIDQEMDESLDNLRAMAASLGCVVEILRQEPVGQCQWVAADGEGNSLEQHMGTLSVAEVLVRPNSHAAPEYLTTTSVSLNTDAPGEYNEVLRHEIVQNLRIALVGASTSGKSSLLGTLTTSILDNGRGKSRLSLLKHRHEISSGVTSSVAHELLGYKVGSGPQNFVINYSSGDVSSWTDVHNLSDRLCFMTDSPGHSRYAKSTFRALISWRPHWSLCCIAAVGDEDRTGSVEASTATSATDLTLAHLDLCLRLDLNAVVVITKMDLATKPGLREVLTKVLSRLKAAGKKPLMLSASGSTISMFSLDSNEALPDLHQITPTEIDEMERITETLTSDMTSSVPIIMTSVVTGNNIGKLHALLSRLPPVLSISSGGTTTGLTDKEEDALFHVDEVFSIPPSRVYSNEVSVTGEDSGVVLCGCLAKGNISVGDRLRLGPFAVDGPRPASMIKRSMSYTAHDVRITSLAPAARSYQQDGLKETAGGLFLDVQVVSLRTLRLPVLTMSEGSTGTIGVDCVDSSQTLGKARKGMVLLAAGAVSVAARSFVATFSSGDFTGLTPPLLLGGHAIAYINSIRAAVRVTALALVDDETTEALAHNEVFTFDEEDDDAAGHCDENQQRAIRITFKFVSSVEWMQRGDQALLVPTITPAGPVAGPAVPSNGLLGFVGTVTAIQV